MATIELLIIDGANAAFGGTDVPSLRRLDAVRDELYRVLPSVLQVVVFDYSMRYKLPVDERSRYRRQLSKDGFYEVEEGTSADPEIIGIARGDATRRAVVSRDTFQDAETNGHVFRGLRVLPFRVHESESVLRVTLDKLRIYQSRRKWTRKNLEAFAPARLPEPKEEKKKAETGPDLSTEQGVRAVRLQLSEPRQRGLDALEERIARELLVAGGSDTLAYYKAQLERDFNMLAFRGVLRGSTDPVGVFLRSCMFLTLSETQDRLNLTESGKRYLLESNERASRREVDAKDLPPPESLRAAMEVALDNRRGTIRLPNLVSAIREVGGQLPEEATQLLSHGGKALVDWVTKQEGIEVTFSQLHRCFVVKRQG